jgi:hypothetical protein
VDGGGAWSRTSSETLCAREGGGTEGKRASDDVHLHAELLRWAGVTKRWRSGETAVCPSLAAKAAARLGFTKQEAAAAGCAEPRARAAAL